MGGPAAASELVQKGARENCPHDFVWRLNGGRATSISTDDDMVLGIQFNPGQEGERLVKVGGKCHGCSKMLAEEKKAASIYLGESLPFGLLSKFSMLSALLLGQSLRVSPPPLLHQP